ncbi:MAG: AMP-binding protein, partial [Gammaproteobacteria bacterium]|nr:AMP-binding protein [Gammaproteobacteria bacterium]
FAALLDGPQAPFVQLDFNHPLYILYSSGTTGKPKCIVHGAGGTLLQHAKEHQLHTGLGPSDTLFFFTTCGWMMWNWLVGALATGCTLLLYDGSPFHPNPATLWRIAEREGVTVFGASPTYLGALAKAGVKPGTGHDLSALRMLLSTGSTLSAEGFEAVHHSIKNDLHLVSMTGGTDLISCFILGNPNQAVHAGELQCKGLGMAVDIYGEDGKPLPPGNGEKGELVCTHPFPSCPLGFWKDADGSRFHDAYFAKFPGVWAHGDFAEATANGGFIIHGRSDAVLNPGGVRIGTAEIYRQVERIDGIRDAVCVGQEWAGDTRIVLF